MIIVGQILANMEELVVEHWKTILVFACLDTKEIIAKSVRLPKHIISIAFSNSIYSKNESMNDCQ